MKIKRIQASSEASHGGDPPSRARPQRARSEADEQELLKCVPKGSVISVDVKEGGMTTYLMKFPKGNTLKSANESIGRVQEKFRGRARSCSPAYENGEASLRVRLSSLGETARITSRSAVVADTLLPWQVNAIRIIKPHTFKLLVLSSTADSVELEVNSIQLGPDTNKRLQQLGVFLYVTAVSNRVFNIRINNKEW